MPIEHRTELARIKTFPQLIAYLRDEMGWPIARDSFEEVDDLFYDFTADELGIDPKTAAKIQEIKRLRPLSPKQPWGIFFVKFEPKRLPVVALRRILSQVALKKRASANSAERAAWAADDLLFVSNYGEGDERQISFAHFSRAQDRHDLPTLKVLGWNNLDTALHLDAVARELAEHLAWPEDDANAEAWRTRWRAAFTLRHREVVTTSKELSIRLAELAGNIRDRIKTALAIETDNGPLTRLMKAFQTALVHDLDADGFADMYAQTIAYGLLSARIADPHKKTADDFAAHMRTNPFLRELMETFLKVGGRRGKAGGPGIDFDELGVSEVVELLDAANMEAVVRDFGDRNPLEDPVIHFYELFLKEYDAKKRMQRGVFYTPRPVVSYIVRSVDELLRTEFGLADGLADTTTWGEMAKRHKDLKIPEGVSPDQDFVQILDPATGTGTFLVEVIDLVHKTLVAKWKAQGHGEKKIGALWNEYVPKHLLTRLHGYELLMAPYAIAHLKVGLMLYETGYRFGAEERARIYLTNAMEPWVRQIPLIGFDALAHEATAVNEIKRHKRFTVAIGNPPYSNFGQLNRTEFLLELLNDYKRGLNEKKLNLDDDFIKFVRFGQHVIQQSRVGALGLITNNVFLDGITHRQMRRSLRETFATIRILDLHGSARKLETDREGGEENVFEIQQGVAIGIFSCPAFDVKPFLLHADLWGTREKKYRKLDTTSLESTEWTPIESPAPNFFFVPKMFETGDDYQSYPGLKEIFITSGNAIKTERDRVSIHFTPEDAKAAVEDFRSKDVAFLRRKYDLETDSRDWKVANAKADVRGNRSEKLFRPILYRPFDIRHTWYSGQTRGFIGTPALPTMKHLIAGSNVAMACLRQTRRSETGTYLVGRGLIGKDIVSIFDIGTVFPLYLYDEPLNFDLCRKESGVAQVAIRRPNLNATFLKLLADALQTPQEPPHGLPVGLTPEDIVHYAYAVFHSPGYRSRYAESLKIDFPRLPLTGDLELFGALAQLGAELVAMHLLESPKLAKPITEFVGGRNLGVEKVSWAKNTVWMDKAQTTGFKGVREDVWNFRIGGYQVCEKWLKDRKGRKLSRDDITHYQKIVVALTVTISLMKEIDEVIAQYGGWPGAFEAAANAPGAEVVEIRKRAVDKKAAAGVQELPLLKAAEPTGEYKPESSGGTGDRPPRRR